MSDRRGDAADPDGMRPAAPPDLRLVAPALAVWTGAFTGSGLRPDLPAWPTAAALGLVLAMAGWAWQRTRVTLALVLLCLLVGAAAGGLRVAGVHAGPVDEWAAAGAAATATVVVTADPVRVQGGQASVHAAQAHAVYLVRVAFRTVTARGSVLEGRLPGLVVAEGRRWARLLPGQRARAEGTLRAARPGQPVTAVLSVRGPPELLGRPPVVQRAAGDLRAGLRDAVSGLPAAERGLVPGLVVGDTSRMPPDLEDDFRTAGLTHLTAVSGANLVIVVGFVLHVGRWLGVRGRWLPVLGALALVGFVVLARPQPSVLRAAAMGLVGLAALSTGRRRSSVAALAAATVLLLLVDPWLSRSYGFALSVLATAGLLVLAPGWATWLNARRVPMPLAQAFTVPAAAQVACAPVVAMLSEQVSLVAVPANLLVAPAVAPATVLGVLATLAGAVADPVAALLGGAAGWPAAWIVAVARAGAALPHAAADWPGTTGGALVLAGLLVGGVLVLRWASHRPPVLAACCAVGVVLAGVQLASPGWPPRGWLLVACDVGQGDALVLSAGSAGAVVVDAGPDPRLVDRCLRGLGVERVALVVLTHLHADHVEGLPGVLRGRSVGAVQVGPYGEPAAGLERVRNWAAATGVPVTQAQPGDQVVVGPLRWEVLWPERIIRGDGSEPNNASLVLLAERDGVSMLLTGDVEPPAQRALLARRRWGSVAVLKVAHHGSAYQDPRFLASAAPRVALVSVGADNDYGHPAPATMRRLTALGAVLGRTDRDGALAVVGPADRLRLVTGPG